MKIKIHKIHKSNIVEYLIVALIIFVTDSLWFRAYFRPINYYIIDILGFVAGVEMLIRRKVPKEYTPVLMMICGILLAQLFNLSTDKLGIYKILVLIFAFSFIKKIDINKFAEIFSNIMVVLAVFSLVCIIFKSVIFNLFSLKIISNGDLQFSTLYIMNFYKNIDIGFLERNVGAFWEPGAYQAYLILAILFLNLLTKSNKRKSIKNIILFITVISTMSTTGFICLGLCGLIMINNKDKKNRGTKILSFIILALIVCVIVTNNNIQEILFSKFNISSTKYISFATRLDTIFVELHLIMKSPLFGLGITKCRVLYEQIAGEYIMDAISTSTSLGAWSTFGIMYFILYNYGFIKLARKLSSRNINFILLIIVFAIILNTENWCYSLLFNILVVYGLIDKKKIILVDNTSNN